MARDFTRGLDELAPDKSVATQKTSTHQVPRGEYRRTPLSIPVELHMDDVVVACETRDMSPRGLRLITQILLPPGTPLQLHCSFGEICYLKLSGQVTFSPSVKVDSHTHRTIGIKFSGLRPWEETILSSAIHELKETPETRQKSSLTMIVSKDAVAVEAAGLYDLLGSAHQAGSQPTAEVSLRRNLALTHFQSAQIEEELSERTQRQLPLTPWDLPTLTLLVNGEELDTRRYDYCVYSDKLITDNRTVLSLLKDLRSGKTRSDYKDYIYARYCIGNKETNQAAIEAAYRASSEFRFFSLSKRMKIAADLHALLLKHRDELINLMIIEGHPRRLAEWEFEGMEQAYRKPSLDFYKRHLTKRIGSSRQELLYWNRKPDGVVCVSPPRNAPCSSSLIAGFALLAGNSLIVKPPLRSPISTLFLWKNVVHAALTENNAPAGTVNLVLGNSDTIVNEWIHSNWVNDVLFIGESKTGLSVGARAYQHGKKPILELSGNDMMFIWKDADLDRAVESLLDGFLGSTQICMVPKKAFIHEDIYETFEQRFISAVGKLKIGLPSDPEVSLSPVLKISEFYEFLEDALANGAKLLCGGARVDHRAELNDRGLFVTPAVISIKDAIVARRLRCIREENFFPLIPLVRVSAKPHQGVTKDMMIFNQMASLANDNEYGLRVSAWVTSAFYTQRFVDQIQNSGLLRINCRHVGFSPLLATHGGTRKSGGPFGELNYVWHKTTHLQGVSVAKRTAVKNG